MPINSQKPHDRRELCDKPQANVGTATSCGPLTI